MKRWFLRIGAGVLVVVLALAGYAYYQLRSRGFMRVPVYETTPPELPEFEGPAVLIFSKTNSFIHGEAIPAAKKMFGEMAARKGWSIYYTDNGAIHNSQDLARFDAIVWNNVTGNVLTETQQRALIDYITAGGGWLGIHGAGDGSSDWAWYNEILIAARFIGHPMDPQFQQATVRIEQPADPIVAHLGPEWSRVDEWYSFENTPRTRGVQVLATLDEDSYLPRYFDKDIGMGDDHPVIWKHCPGEGRAIYSAMGHTAESFVEQAHIELLERGLAWAAGLTGTACREAPAAPVADEETP